MLERCEFRCIDWAVFLFLRREDRTLAQIAIPWHPRRVQSVMASPAETQPVAAAWQIFAASAANNVMQFQAAARPTRRPVANSAAVMHEHVVIFRQPWF